MAEENIEPAGYNFDFVDPPCCGRICCDICLKTIGEGEPCPNCKMTGWQSFEDKKCARNIQTLIIRCKRKEEGCDWTGELNQRDRHTSECGYELLKCKNECCGLDGEVTEIYRRLEETHLNEECPKRIVACELCEKQGQYCEITGSHAEKCPEVEIQCENQHCENWVKRCNIQRHNETCPYRIVQCKYAEYGCTAKFRRQDKEDHENDTRVHLDTVIKCLDLLKEQQARFDKRLENLENASSMMPEMQCEMSCIQQAIGVYNQRIRNPLFPFTLKPKLEEADFNKLTCKLEGFSRYINTGRRYISPSFYTSKGGYKMLMMARVKIKPEDDRIIVIDPKFHMMLGNYDKLLKWPFCPAELQIELLNKKHDGLHETRIVLYEENQESEGNSRVEEGEISGEGWGFDASIVLTRGELQNYLLDDTLYFRLSVINAPRPQPWLVNNA